MTITAPAIPRYPDNWPRPQKNDISGSIDTGLLRSTQQGFAFQYRNMGSSPTRVSLTFRIPLSDWPAWSQWINTYAITRWCLLPLVDQYERVDPTPAYDWSMCRFVGRIRVQPLGESYVDATCDVDVWPEGITSYSKRAGLESGLGGGTADPGDLWGGADPDTIYTETGYYHGERIPWSPSGSPVSDDSLYVWGPLVFGQTLAQRRAQRVALPTNNGAYTPDEWWFNRTGWASPFNLTSYYTGVTNIVGPSTAVNTPDAFIDQDPFFLRTGFYQSSRVNIFFQYVALPATSLGYLFDCNLVSSLLRAPAGDGPFGWGRRDSGGGNAFIGIWQKANFGSLSSASPEVQAAFQQTNNCNQAPDGFYNPIVTRQVTETAWAGFRDPQSSGTVTKQSSGTFRSIRWPYIDKTGGIAFTTPGIGPVLRSDDTNYNNQTFWEAALADAIAAHSDNTPATFVANVPDGPPDWGSWVYGVDYPVSKTVDGTEDPEDAVYYVVP